MSGIEQTLYDKLAADADVSALVEERIFPLCAPEDIKQAFIIYQRISGVRVKDIGGPAYVAQPRMQVDCYALSYEEAREIAESVRLSLDGWRSLTADVVVIGSSLITDREFWEADSDPKFYRVSMDFMLTHTEATA